MENSSFQSSNAVNPPASGGQSEDYKTVADRLEREKRGIYEDLRSEREKRQALEERLSLVERQSRSVASQSSPTATNPVEAQVDAFVTQYVTPRVEKMVQPLRETNQLLSRNLEYRDAIEWLAEQEDTKVSKVRGSKLEEDIARIVRDRNMGNMPMLNGVQAAYEILQKEKHEKAEAEKARSENIQAQGTVQPTMPASGSQGKVWKESDIQNMPLDLYAKHKQDIQLAVIEGRFIQDVTGQQKK